jgi:putative SOS response-associated peptidase YedK
MCGAFGFIPTRDELREFFELVGSIPDLPARYNARPTQPMPVVVRHSPKRIEVMRWGFIEPWSKDGKSKLTLFNARDDNVGRSPLFKKSLAHSRCLVPMSFFYEFAKREGKSHPYAFLVKDSPLFACAGLSMEYKHPNGTTIKCFTIITTAANAVVGKVHPRMPVILDKEDQELWIDPDVIEPERVLPLLRPYPATKMTSYPVSRDVNSFRNDRPDLINPIRSE